VFKCFRVFCLQAVVWYLFKPKPFITESIFQG
jgi:hypothetical protein